MRLLSSILVALTVASTSTLALSADLPEGWTRADPGEGRSMAAVHRESHARMEALHLAVPDSERPVFAEAFDKRMASLGFVVGAKPETVESALGDATLRRYAYSLHGKEFKLVVLEVRKDGGLWHFSAFYRPSEALADSKLRSDLEAFAAAVLAH